MRLGLDVAKGIELVPDDASPMEALVVHKTLQRIRERVLGGEPSGVLIDQALEETVTVGSSAPVRDQSLSEYFPIGPP